MTPNGGRKPAQKGTHERGIQRAERRKRVLGKVWLKQNGNVDMSGLTAKQTIFRRIQRQFQVVSVMHVDALKKLKTAHLANPKTPPLERLIVTALSPRRFRDFMLEKYKRQMYFLAPK